jgi:hypothetical protein
MDWVHGPSSRVHGLGTHLGSSNLRSTIRILCKGIYPSNLGRTGKIGRRGGWLRSGAAWAHAHGGAAWPSVAAHRSSGFLEPWWSVSNEVYSYGITAMRGTRLG